MTGFKCNIITNERLAKEFTRLLLGADVGLISRRLRTPNHPISRFDKGLSHVSIEKKPKMILLLREKEIK